MDEVEILLTIAEVAVAFAGFASIVSVLGRRNGRDISPFHRAALRGMILTSLAVVFCSFAPLVPLKFGIDPIASWRLSGLFLFAVAVAVTIAGARDGRHMRSGGVPLAIRLVGAAQLLLPAGLAALAASGWFPNSSPALYLLALLLLLALAGALFAGILLTFIAPREPE